jgi:multiple sugar transport system permease protein
VFNNSDFVFLTTAGGPVRATETLPVYAFAIGWTNYNVGQMAAVSVAMLAVLVVIVAIYLKALRVDEED